MSPTNGPCKIFEKNRLRVQLQPFLNKRAHESPSLKKHSSEFITSNLFETSIFMSGKIQLQK